MTIPVRKFDIFPALHLSKGRLVDLASSETSDTPVFDADTDQLAAARHAIKHGAQWLHVVNVDTSFNASAEHNWTLLEQLCQLPVKVQYGGGIANAENIDNAIDAGVSRVLLNTLAIKSPDIVSGAIIKHGRERFALSIRASADGVVLGHDWEAVGGLEVITLAVQMYQLGITTLVHTRLQTDGTMSGTELKNSCELAELSGMDVIVGGEMRELQDVVECYNQPGITGVLVGKAFQTGSFSLADALNETRAALAFESGMPRWKQEQQTRLVRLRRGLSNAFLMRHMPELTGLRVLDAGGGNGLASLPFAQSGAFVDVVDRSMAMLQDLESTAHANNLQERITAHSSDIRNINQLFDDHTFDLVICHNVIQYSPAWESLLVSMIQPLKSRGLLSLVVRNWHAEPYRINIEEHSAQELPALLERISGPSRVFDADVLFFSASFLKHWLKKQGFSILGDYGLLCRHDTDMSATSVGGEQLLIDKLHSLESAMGELEPYKLTARYLQIVVRKL